MWASVESWVVEKLLYPYPVSSYMLRVWRNLSGDGMPDGGVGAKALMRLED